jgi:hypothetical protein
MPDSYTLKLTSKQMDVVGNALAQRPYAEVAQLLQEITQQIQAQQAQQTPLTPGAALANAGGETHNVVQ